MTAAAPAGPRSSSAAPPELCPHLEAPPPPPSAEHHTPVRASVKRLRQPSPGRPLTFPLGGVAACLASSASASACLLLISSSCWWRRSKLEFFSTTSCSSCASCCSLCRACRSQWNSSLLRDSASWVRRRVRRRVRTRAMLTQVRHKPGCGRSGCSSLQHHRGSCMTSAPSSDAGSPPAEAPAASPGLSPPAGQEGTRKGWDLVWEADNLRHERADLTS